MKSICIINGNMSRGGGTERMTQILADSLAAQTEYKVFVISMTECTEPYFQLSAVVHFSSLHTSWNGRLAMIQAVNRLNKFIRANQIDVVVNVDVFLSMYTIPIKMLHSKLKVVTWEMFNSKNDIGLKWCHSLRQFALNHSDCYICQTKADMESFRREFKHTSHITFIYNPFEIMEEYDDYDISSKSIITAGHFFYTKGYDLAVEVAKLVMPNHPAWKWYFYGDGVEMDNVKDLVSKYGLDKQVIFAGRTKDITEKYKQSAMYVMTSRLEGFGLVLLEAKCCNLPTISFDIPFGPAEIIDEPSGGILIPAFDVEKMAERMSELMDNDELRQVYSKRAKSNIDKFSLNEFIVNWKKLLSNI